MTLVRGIYRWHCPACGLEDVTHKLSRTHMHVCPRLRGLSAPMLPAGTKAKLELHEREDYVGTENVQTDPERGRPVQSIITTRDNGQDVTIFAPSASVGAEAHQ